MSARPSDAMERWSMPTRYDDSYVPASDQLYWFPVRETMDPAERDDAVLARVREVMAYAYENAPFYQRKWSDAGLHPQDIRTLADFERVPVVTKAELRQAQEAHQPFGDYLCIPESEIARVHGTSGTTGRPTAFAIGRDDWRTIANNHARIMWAMGIRPSDHVFIGSVFSLYMGSWGALVGAERLGATVFPFGAGVAGMTTRAVSWMLQTRPSAFYGTPSYALRLVEVAEDMKVDPKDFGIRIMFFSGEPGASVPSIRSQIETAFGAAVFDAGSMAEMTPWMNLAETTGHTGMLCWQDIVYTEVVHPGTHARVPFGSEGTPAYTHLERTSQPMIRLVSGDLTRWEAPGSPCGRTYPSLPKGIYGRIDDMFTIRGENIYPSAIDEIVSGLAGYGGEYRIVVSRRESMDALAVRVEYSRDLADESHSIDAFRDLAEKELQAALGVRAKVHPVPFNTLERTDLKSNRVIDERDLFRSLLT
jgi:phenylacetate-CoA ligase